MSYRVSKPLVWYYVIFALLTIFGFYIGVTNKFQIEYQYSFSILIINNLFIASIFLRKKWYIFYPLGLFYFLVSFSATLKTIYLGINNDNVYDANFWNNYLSGSILIFNFSMLLIVSALFVEWKAFTNKSRKTFTKQFQKYKVSIVSIVTISIGIWAFLHYYTFYTDPNIDFISKKLNKLDIGSENRFYSLQYWSYKLTVLAKLPFYLFMAVFFIGKENIAVKVAGIISLFFTILLGLYFDNRSELLILALDLIILLSITLKGRAFLWIILISVSFTITFFYVTFLRIDSYYNFEAVFDVLFGQKYLASPDKLGTIIATPLHNFDLLYFKSYLGFLMLPIKELSEPFRTLHFVVATASYNARIGIPPGGLAESYINGGIFSVLLIAITTGILLGYMQHKMKVSYQNNDKITLLLLIIFSTRFVFFFVNTDMGTAILKAVFETFLVYIILLLSGIRRNSVYV